MTGWLLHESDVRHPRPQTGAVMQFHFPNDDIVHHFPVRQQLAIPIHFCVLVRSVADAPDGGEQSDEVQFSHEHLLGIVGPMSRFDQQGAGSPRLHPVAERARLESIVVRRDVPADELAERPCDQGTDTHGPKAHRRGCSFVVEGGRKQRQRRHFPRRADGCNPLIVQIEPEPRPKPALHLAEKHPFRRHQHACIPVHVHSESRLTLEAFCAIGVHHRDDVDGRLLQKLRAPRFASFGLHKIIQHIHDRQRGSGFITVHLRPEKDLLLPMTKRGHVNAPLLGRGPNLALLDHPIAPCGKLAELRRYLLVQAIAGAQIVHAELFVDGKKKCRECVRCHWSTLS